MNTDAAQGHAALRWHDRGAQLLQVMVDSVNLFYCSPLATQFSDRPVRGGVPVMFPQFADKGIGPKHGLVRMEVWHKEANRADAWSLDLPAQPDIQWLGHARLQVQASVHTSPQSVRLTQTLSVTNTGDCAFAFTGGLHPYFAMTDVTHLRIAGLDDVAFEDRYSANQPVSSAFLNGQAFERLYAQAPAIEFGDGQRTCKLSCSGFDNWMVWNPGIELTQGLVDLPVADWQRFVCIEPVIAAKPRTLEPEQTFVGVMVAEVRRRR